MPTLLPDRPAPAHRPASIIAYRRPDGPPGRVVVEVSHLAKIYARVPVVDDVSFEVRQGEIFGLLGANGAGKTTTVECLQGLRRPDGGRLRVMGLDPMVDRRRLRAMVGSQLQDSALPDRLRVGEAVALFNRGATVPATVHLERWGLGDAVRTSFADLSGGQRQRLCIVLALLNSPRVVFLDELTQGLDPAARRSVWDMVREVRDQGATVVLVSHFAEEIEALCDRVAVMSAGRVVDTGTPREVTDRHAQVTTVTFSRPAQVDDGTLGALLRRNDVHRVIDDQGQVTVTGTSTMVGAACAVSLDDNGTSPPDLRVHHASLDDALVSLIGARS
jgi:ABC-2 type transport system ATP-binding protein